MSAKNTTWGMKRAWLRVIATGLHVTGGKETNFEAVKLWLRSEGGRREWQGFADALPPDGSIKNYLTEARRSFGELDGPWSIGQTVAGVAGRSIESVDLPIVLRMATLRLVSGSPLTTRQAIWVARLRYFFPADMNDEEGFSFYWFRIMNVFAVNYALREQLAAGLQHDSGSDTSDLDGAFMFGFPYNGPEARLYLETLTSEGAVKLGLIPQVDLDFGLDKEHISRLISFEDSEMSALQHLSDSLKETIRDGVQAPSIMLMKPWEIAALTIGLRLLSAREDWGSLTEEKQRNLATGLRRAVESHNWKTYARQTGLKEPYR